MRKIEISENLKDIMQKLSKKNKKLYNQLLNKIEEVSSSYNVEHYKNLRYNMKDSKRVQVGSFVLVFQYNKSDNSVKFDDFDHHDKIYKKKF